MRRILMAVVLAFLLGGVAMGQITHPLPATKGGIPFTLCAPEEEAYYDWYIWPGTPDGRLALVTVVITGPAWVVNTRGMPKLPSGVSGAVVTTTIISPPQGKIIWRTKDGKEHVLELGFDKGGSSASVTVLAEAVWLRISSNSNGLKGWYIITLLSKDEQ